MNSLYDCFALDPDSWTQSLLFPASATLATRTPRLLSPRLWHLRDANPASVNPVSVILATLLPRLRFLRLLSRVSLSKPASPYGASRVQWISDLSAFLVI